MVDSARWSRTIEEGIGPDERVSGSNGVLLGVGVLDGGDGGYGALRLGGGDWAPNGLHRSALVHGHGNSHIRLDFGGVGGVGVGVGVCVGVGRRGLHFQHLWCGL